MSEAAALALQHSDAGVESDDDWLYEECLAQPLSRSTVFSNEPGIVRALHQALPVLAQVRTGYASLAFVWSIRSLEVHCC